VRARGVLAAAALALSVTGCLSAPPEAVADARFEEAWERSSDLLTAAAAPATVEERRYDLAEEALHYARRAVELEPDRVEGHYYAGVALGRVLELSTIASPTRIGELEESGRRAADLDPAFRCAGPLRFLAMLYFKAPAFPVGPALAGEDEEIERLFERAIALAPTCPENYGHYAEFLIDRGRNEEAAEHVARARALLGEHDGLEPYERAEWAGKLARLNELLIR